MYLYRRALLDITAMAGDADGRRLLDRAKDHFLSSITALIREGRNRNEDIPGLIKLETDVHFNKVSLNISKYKWVQSGSGTAEYYLLDVNKGPSGLVPSFTAEPSYVYEDHAVMTAGTVGSLAAGEWDYGNNDSLAGDTIYIRLSDDADPNTKSEQYVECSADSGLVPVHEDIGHLDILQINEVFPSPYVTSGNSYQQQFILKDAREIARIATNTHFALPDNEVWVWWSGRYLYAFKSDTNSFDYGTDYAWMQYIEQPNDATWDDSKSQSAGGTDLQDYFTVSFIKEAIRASADSLLQEDNI